MTDALFPTSTNVQEIIWTKHIRATLEVVSENECAAHAALCHDWPIDFYFYNENSCYLGDLAYTKEGTGGNTLHTIHIRKCMYDFFNG